MIRPREAILSALLILDTAAEVGRYVLAMADGTEVDRGKYIVLWRHTEDGWKLHRDIFNSDLPAPQPE